MMPALDAEALATLMRSFEARMQAIADNICPECQRPIERKEQQGRCVYAWPCNHRLYLGQLARRKKEHRP